MIAAPAPVTETPASSSVAATRVTPGVLRVRNLTYNRKQLGWLFCWLLLADLAFMIVSQIEPSVLPILLKNAGASDHHVAWILGSLVQVTQLVLNPIYSTTSDRTRTRWGRRIPYLFIVTPLASLLLAATPYAPEVATWLQEQSWAAAVFRRVPVAPAVLMYGLFVFAFYLFYSGTSSIFFYLFRDVVPESHMGRFMALFRMVGALGTFVLNYWLLGVGVRLPHEMFLAMAGLNLVGFMALCWFVKEPDYPPVERRVEAGPRPLLRRAIAPVTSYFRECYSDPLYVWTHVCRLMVYASVMVATFRIFFALDELGMTVEDAGKALSWSSLLWVVVAYPLGLLVDRWKVFRVMKWALWIQSVSYLLSFFLIRDSATFLAFSLVTGVLYWAIMLCQFMLGQEVFPALKLGQFFSATVVFQAVMIAAVVSPFCGWLFDTLKGTTRVLALPGIGSLEIGPYRYVMLLLSVVFFVSLLGLHRVEALHAARQRAVPAS
jgi:maltose/moltooligosaccharide transporter